jgi:hypothetical protein
LLQRSGTFYITSDVLYYFHMNEELQITEEVPLESVVKIMINFSNKAHMTLIKPIFVLVIPRLTPRSSSYTTSR